MKVLGLLGSPRPGQHTATLLEACLSGASAAGAEVVTLPIAKMTIKPCLACYACAKTGDCAIKTDDMAAVYAALAEADVILLASPLYFAGVSAQLKAMIDRAQVFWSRQNELALPALWPKKRRLAALICTGGAPNRAGKNFWPAIATAKLWVQALEAEWQGELTIGNTDRVAVWEQAELLEQAKRFGLELVQAVASS